MDDRGDDHVAGAKREGGEEGEEEEEDENQEMDEEVTHAHTYTRTHMKGTVLLVAHAILTLRLCLGSVSPRRRTIWTAATTIWRITATTTRMAVMHSETTEVRQQAHACGQRRTREEGRKCVLPPVLTRAHSSIASTLPDEGETF